MKRYSSLPSLVCWLLVGMVVLMTASPFQSQGWAEERQPTADRKDLGPPGDIVIPTLNFPETDLTTVIRSLAKISGLNILAGKDVTGTVSCYFENVTVRDALESILATNGYGYIVTGNIVQVRPSKDLGEDQVQTVTQVFILQYLDAEEVEESLSEAFGGAAGRGAGAAGAATLGKRISSNPGANAIIVTDIPSQVSEIAQVLAKIDRRLKQVMIQAYLVEVGYDFGREIGLDWSVYDYSENLVDPNDPRDVRDTVDINLAPIGTRPLHWQFDILQDDFKLNALLKLDEDHSDIKVLANPRIMALHNRTAVIRIVDDEPYVETTAVAGVGTSESVVYKETGITLEVTPRINDEGMVVMRVVPSQMIPGPAFTGRSDIFSVNERSAETELILGDGNTAVIGGLVSQSWQKGVQQVPLLGDIPILGYLFKRNKWQLSESELLIFVTPHIIKEEPELTDHEASQLGRFKYVNETLERRVRRYDEKQEDARAKQAEKDRRHAEKRAERLESREEWSE